MSNIDLSQLVTADQKAGPLTTETLILRKQECRSRIFAVIGETAQINLAAAAAAGLLDKPQMDVYRNALEWINAMRAATASGDWPKVPTGMRKLAEQY